MFEAFNSQSKNIGQMLGRDEPAAIIVPPFQRPYSWEKKHVQVFWNDIVEHQKRKETNPPEDRYFLGPIVTLSKSNSEIELLDGQQRLATATILFSVLRDIAIGIGTEPFNRFAYDIQRDMIEKDDEGTYALQMGEVDNLYFRNSIQRDPRDGHERPKAKLRSHRNIQTAINILTDGVRAVMPSADEAKQVQYLRKLSLIVRRDLVMASIPVLSETQAFKIFETLNDRGLRLSPPDLLLNYLMREAKSPGRKVIREHWTMMTEQMGRRDIARFLRHMWVSNYGDLKKEDLFTALKNHIEKHQIDSVVFAEKCAADCNSYIALLDVDEKQLHKSARYVRIVARDLDFQPAFPLLLSCFQTLDLKYFERVLQLLLVFLVRRSIISGLDSGETEDILFRLARDVRERMADGQNNYKGCFAYLKDEFVKYSPVDAKVITDVSTVYLHTDDARYVLTRLANYMQSPTKEMALGDVSLEHIFPQNPSDEWKNKDALGPYTDHIGNLTMLGENLNAEAAKNWGFARKKAESYSKSELKMVQRIAADYKKWDAEAVLNRAKKLAPLIPKLWNFDNPSRV
jgi:hypothetical protein